MFTCLENSRTALIAPIIAAATDVQRVHRHLKHADARAGVLAHLSACKKQTYIDTLERCSTKRFAAIVQAHQQKWWSIYWAIVESPTDAGSMARTTEDFMSKWGVWIGGAGGHEFMRDVRKFANRGSAPGRVAA